MANQIERVRYYDGEYLRGFDFDAEQRYHIELRRRLNRSLHLWGIVEGLDLIVDIQAGITQVSIAPGMAIDAFGREIFLFAPYTFGDADISFNRISQSGSYDIWVHYKKAASTPPSAGYGSCQEKNQYTRWIESYSVVLLNSKTTPFQDPAFTDPDTDNPEQDQAGVLLGSISVDPTSVTDQFSKPSFDKRRVFAGIRAQRIRPPVDAIAKFGFLDKNTALTPPVSLGVEANLFSEQNVVIGDDFQIHKDKIKPKPTGTYPNLRGNLKVASDLFVQGNLYSKDNDNWLTLGEYMKKFMPDILVGIQRIDFPGSSTKTSLVSDTFKFSVASNRIGKIGSASATASVASVQLNKRSELDTIMKATDQIQVFIDSASAVPSTTQDKACDVSVTWSVGPAIKNTGAFECAILELWISYVVVCFPAP